MLNVFDFFDYYFFPQQRMQWGFSIVFLLIQVGRAWPTWYRVVPPPVSPPVVPPPVVPPVGAPSAPSSHPVYSNRPNRKHSNEFRPVHLVKHETSFSI